MKTDCSLPPTSPKNFPREVPKSGSKSSSPFLANLTSYNRRHKRPSISMNFASGKDSEENLRKS